MATIIWEGSDFERIAKLWLEHQPRWRDGFQNDAGALGVFAFFMFGGALSPHLNESSGRWLMALFGFICLFTALAQRRVLVEAPVWLVSTMVSRLPLKVVTASDYCSPNEWREPRSIALALTDTVHGEARFGVSFRRIGVTRCYVERSMLPRVRRADWREEFDILPM